MIKIFVTRLIKPLWRYALVLIWMLSLLGGSGPMHQALASEITLDVDTQVDSNEQAFQGCTNQPDDCSLRGAITWANLNAVDVYVIYVPVGTYRLTLEGVQEDGNTSGDLDVYGRISLQGESAEDTILEGIWKDRVLDIHSGARVELQDITVQGGQAAIGANPGTVGEPGGGILNRGELVLRESVVRDNRAGDGAAGATDGYLEIDGGHGGSGGGIYNLGAINISDSKIMNNQTGKGGNGGGRSLLPISPPYRGDPGVRKAGDGGSGGGILNRGWLNIETSLIFSNIVGQAGSPGICRYETGTVVKSGNNGMGGGIYNQRRVEREQ